MSSERPPDWDIDHLEYPSNAALDKIRNWAWEDGFENLMRFIKPLWRYADCGYWKEKRQYKGRKRYYLSTAGWSGNEDIIAALRQNFAFWALCWVKSERGGHYVFEIPVKLEKQTNRLGERTMDKKKSELLEVRKDNVERLGAGKWRFFRKKVPTRAFQTDFDFFIHTREGAVYGCAGDWIALDSEGNPYPIGDKIFRELYEPVEEENLDK
ncbi:MAG: hypothetical protein DRJ03_28500 [Chloroflexi bacterium]|nr:MAG: hypothetical protein DRJ03_28500 [Chloroflexota bacterium]